MALINPEIVGLARVVTANSAGGSSASYQFVNGFEAGTPTGAQPGAAAILCPAPGEYVVFLDEPVDPGAAASVSPASPANQGGIKAVVDLVGVATPLNTSTIGAFIAGEALLEARWYYGDYALPSPQYAGVNPEKAIHIAVFDSLGAPSTSNVAFDIVVFKNPTTIYKF